MLKSTGKDAVERCTTCCTLYHCPLCPRVKYKPSLPFKKKNLQVQFKLQRWGTFFIALFVTKQLSEGKTWKDTWTLAKVPTTRFLLEGFYSERIRQEVVPREHTRQDRSKVERVTKMSDLSLYLTNVNVSLGQTMETNKVGHCDATLAIFSTTEQTFFKINTKLLP